VQTSIKETFDLAPTLLSQARTATANGTSVDLSPYAGAVALIVPSAWTDGTHAIKLQESADNSTWNDVAATQIDGTSPVNVTSAPTAVTRTRLGYLGTQRYIRAVLTVAGATTGAVIGVEILRGLPRRMPK
jgi:hypothetical protein